MKRVFIIHGWGADSKKQWFQWLKKELQEKGYEVFVLDMPETDHPKRELWIPYLAANVGNCNKDTYFIGHSIGCNAILRYLSSLGGEIAGGVVLVAPYYGDEVVVKDGPQGKIAAPWLALDINLEKVKQATKNITAVFSDDDPSVLVANAKFFEKNLFSKIIVEHGKGHFRGSQGIDELPSALQAILDFTKN